ncbi:MAG: hypothetical protein HYX57_05840 [Chloroflexi bacterium]|nr:hypothetical protein [Chloroflexota bacterium]
MSTGPGRLPGLVRLVAVGVLAAACGGPILANPTLPPGVVPTKAPIASRAPDPQPIAFPRDDGPHDRLTEWWYYTGHLRDAAGGRWGFEFVVFQARRGDLPTAWASHFALTDETGGTFQYDQRSSIDPLTDRSSSGTSPFAFELRDPTEPLYDGPTAVPSAIGTRLPRTWSMAGAGAARLVASFDAGATGIDLDVTTARPAVLQDGDGWIDFGPAGGSYYYSRPRLQVSGTVVVDSVPRAVEGIAWFDHQWGDFIAVGGGGWDWFAVNLDDGTDLTVSLVRATDGTYPLVYGTLVAADGTTRNLDRDAFTVTPTGSWTSPRTGATYPAGWALAIPGEGLLIGLEPTVADQELDTRATTGVIYWEGSQVVTATRNGSPIGGEAYVELTGYAPAAP